jgi:hypothetical protein
LTSGAPIDRSRPSAVDVLTGLVGRGGRAGVTIVNVGIGSIRPAAELVREAWHSEIGTSVRAAVYEGLDGLEESGRIDRRRAAETVDRLLANVVEEVVEQLIASKTMDRVVETVLESRFYDDAVDRVLESDELWRIVYRISHSPEVTSAITSSSSNLAGEVADQVRRRTEIADEVAERIMGGLLRRVPRNRLR